MSISFCAQRAGRVPGSSSVTTGSSIYRNRGFNLTFLYRDFPRLIAPSWIGVLKRTLFSTVAVAVSFSGFIRIGISNCPERNPHTGRKTFWFGRFSKPRVPKGFSFPCTPPAKMPGEGGIYGPRKRSFGALNEVCSYFCRMFCVRCRMRALIVQALAGQFPTLGLGVGVFLVRRLCFVVFFRGGPV